MIPLFSATNTRPLGANSIAMGSVSPVKAIDSWKPGGSVTPRPRPPAAASAQQVAAQASSARTASAGALAQVESKSVYGT